MYCSQRNQELHYRSRSTESEREKHGGFLEQFFGMDSLKGVILKFQEIELKNTRDIEFDDLSMDGMPLSFRNAVSSSVDFVVDGMRERYESLLNDNCIDMCAGSAVNGLSMLFNHDVWPENDLNLDDYGEEVISALIVWFRPVLERYHVD